MKKWQISSDKKIFSKKIFTLREAECYHPVKEVKHSFFLIDTMNWINIVALTDKEEFIMVKQHRLGTDEITVETPAGLIEKNENPEIAAGRELKEETGYKPDKMIFLKKLSANPSIQNNYIYFYLALGCKKIFEQNLDEAEDIEIQILSVEQITEMIKNGSIDHSIALNALNLYFLSDFCKYTIKI